MREGDAGVIVVGAGPTGLMLAAELRLAGVEVLVLERALRPRETPRAGGIGGQILELLRRRGVLAALEEAAGPGGTHAAPVFPFGEIHLDFSGLEEPPMRGLSLAQRELERVLESRALELGATVWRGHEVLGVAQDEDGVTVAVRGPDGWYDVSAPYVVGCDGPRSRVRELAGTPFPGVTYPEVNRLGRVTVPDAVRRSDGALEVPGFGVLGWGFTRTPRGAVGVGSLSGDVVMVHVVEEDAGAGFDEDAPMGLAELEDSVARVLGGRLPMTSARRLSRWRFEARLAARYQAGRVFMAGDAAHQFPSTGVGLSVGMLDAANLAWKLGAALAGRAPDGLVETYGSERRAAGERALMQTQAQVALRRGCDEAGDALRALFAELVSDDAALVRMGRLLSGADVRYGRATDVDAHPLTGLVVPPLPSAAEEALRAARPVLLDLAGRPDLRETAADWGDRVLVRTAVTADRPADALLLRPDTHVAWAADVGESPDSAVFALREALGEWFGAPVPIPVTGRSHRP